MHGQPPDHYQVPFSSNEACEAARLQLIKDAERIGHSMIERASAQDRQIGWLGPFEDAASICPQAYIAWLAVSLRVFPLGAGGPR